jgi:hypothetical protein
VPGTWTTCASEGGSCAVNGTAQVRYGTATAYVTKTVTGTIACSNASFGDPAPGYGKTCSIGSATTPTPAPTPMPTPAPAPSTETWTTCANEGGTCTVSGTREVRYGYAGKFASKIVSGAVACSNAVFGDPYPNYGKSCSYSSVAR